MESLTADHRASVEQILGAGRHLLTLINEVLDISRIEAGQLALESEAIPLAGTVPEAVGLIAPLAAPRNIALTVEPGPWAAESIWADRQRFKQVLLNLLSNAVKYNRDHGRVTISGRAAASGRIRIEITDTGRGIPARRMAQLFSPFERLGAEGTGIEGAGIGLALSKKLVEAMGGTIGATSEFGQGSIFWVELPRAEGRPREQDCVLGPATALALPGETKLAPCKVLCIEDNLSNFLLIKRILATSPELELIPAMQGRAGLDLAREHLPNLILLDAHLPDMRGDEVLRRLQIDPQTRGIPVGVVSADATERHIQRLLEAGVRAYLTKPIDVWKLRAFVASTLQEAAAAAPGDHAV